MVKRRVEVAVALELGWNVTSGDMTIVLIVFGVVWDSLELELVATVA